MSQSQCYTNSRLWEEDFSRTELYMTQISQFNVSWLRVLQMEDGQACIERARVDIFWHPSGASQAGFDTCGVGAHARVAGRTLPVTQPG